jgi:hypothetical protein
MRLVPVVRRIVPVALAAALAACGDSSGPSGPFSASGTSADVQSVSAAFSPAAVQSFTAIGGEISANLGSGAAAAVATAPTARTVVGTAASQKYASLLTERLGVGARPSYLMAGIPGQYLGKTFEWDATSGHYVATARTGAPSNGVRFMLYAVNPVTLQPATPLDELGYADITASSTSSSVTARAQIVAGGVTYLDYSLTATASGTGGTVTISGFATNGTDRVNFTLDNTLVSDGQGGFNLDITYTAAVPTRQFGVTLKLALAGGTASTVTVDLTAHGPHGTVSLKGTDTDGSGTFSVTTNGQPFATITVSPSGQSFTGANGAQLTAEEQTALDDIFAVFGDSLSFFGDLLEPLSTVS